ncbi:MAG: hypothetical protein WEF86_03010 [Gemmatimonadota bacterium]
MMRRSLAMAWACCSVLGAAAPMLAAAQDGASHLLIVSGLSGEERFAAAYAEWGAALTEAVIEEHGMPAANVVWLAEDAGAHPRVKDRSTVVNIGRELQSLAQRAGEHDRIMVLLFGHGSYQNGESRLALPGPDLSGAELSALLAPFETQRVAVVNAASASGGFIQDLAAPNRVVITATKSGFEQNETVFGGHFTAAFTTDGADVDQDGRVSLLEAFAYTRREVEREYERGNKLLTEHATLDGIGDGTGVGAVEPAAPHARLARTFFLGPAGGAAAADASPELRALYQARDALQAQLDALRARKDRMTEAEYEAELEEMLVGIARNAQEIRRLEGGGT